MLAPIRQKLRRRARLVVIAALLAWSVVIGLSVAWTMALYDSEIRHLARAEGLAAFERDVAHRAWIAELGGVYGPVAAIEPNPHLDVPNRDLDTAVGRLTLVNPAYMTRLVHDIAGQRSEILGHITSLDPVNPANAPDAWETAALRRFEAGEAEVSGVASIDGTPHLRLMRPLMVEEPCLACHEQQGYRVGEVRGGISAAVPMASVAALVEPSRRRNLAGHAVLWLVGTLVIAIVGLGVVRLLGDLDRARREAEAANRAKSDFLATMSHELRTPLNAILGFSEIQRDELFGPIGQPRYREYAAGIHESGRHLLALIDDVLDLSKIEAGKTELAPEWLPLADLMASVEAQMSGRAQARGIALSVGDAPGLELHADRRAMRQILNNLLSNALKFTGAGGRVSVSVALADGPADGPAKRSPGGAGDRNGDGGAAVAIRVADTGCGIAAGDLSRLARPFERVSNAYIRSGEGGTGLGLALVRQLATLHGGRMEIESRVGEGTVVTVRLPGRLRPGAGGVTLAAAAAAPW
jgi:signal transduction histidine kinase